MLFSTHWTLTGGFFDATILKTCEKTAVSLCPTTTKKLQTNRINKVSIKERIVCLNSKFPPPVELCWQNKNISKLGILNNQRWQYNYFTNMIRKH
jgi:hypothetical protein